MSPAAPPCAPMRPPCPDLLQAEEQEAAECPRRGVRETQPSVLWPLALPVSHSCGGRPRDCLASALSSLRRAHSQLGTLFWLPARERHGEGTHPPSAGKGGLKGKGEGKGDGALFRVGGMASDRLPYTPHPGLPHGPLISTTSGGPRPGDLKTQGTKEEGRCKLTHWGMLQRQEAPQAHTLPRVET